MQFTYARYFYIQIIYRVYLKYPPFLDQMTHILIILNEVLPHH
jgi:hypothetical protein